MKIWLFSSLLSNKNHSHLRIKAEAEKLKLSFKTVAPEKFEIIIENHKEQLLYNNKPIKLPDVVIARFSETYFAKAILRQLEKQGVIVINTLAAREIADEKLTTIQALAAHNIPVPKSIVAKFPIDIDLIEKELSFPLVLKKTQGSQGRGVMLCETRNQLEDIIGILEETEASKFNFIFQEFVSEKKGKDIRVFVIGGRAVGAMIRTAKEGGFKANISGGGTAENLVLTPEIEWLAVESTRAAGLDICGVDLLYDKDGYKVCEINASPGLKGIEQATGINIAKEILKYIQFRFGHSF